MSNYFATCSDLKRREWNVCNGLLFFPFSFRIHSSQSCGPFIRHNTSWAVVPETVGKLPVGLKTFLYALASEPFAVSLFVVTWWALVVFDTCHVLLDTSTWIFFSVPCIQTIRTFHWVQCIFHYHFFFRAVIDIFVTFMTGLLSFILVLVRC